MVYLVLVLTLLVASDLSAGTKIKKVQAPAVTATPAVGLEEALVKKLREKESLIATLDSLDKETLSTAGEEMFRTKMQIERQQLAEKLRELMIEIKLIESQLKEKL